MWLRNCKHLHKEVFLFSLCKIQTTHIQQSHLSLTYCTCRDVVDGVTCDLWHDECHYIFECLGCLHNFMKAIKWTGFLFNIIGLKAFQIFPVYSNWSLSWKDETLKTERNVVFQNNISIFFMHAYIIRLLLHKLPPRNNIFVDDWFPKGFKLSNKTVSL